MENINRQLKQKPVIFLAFANDRVDYAACLRNLPKELRGIREELEKAKNKNLCEVVERSNVSIEDILDVFQDDTYKNRIAIFHYGGHASGYQLLLESLAGGRAPAYREGLAAFLARQEGLKFVFLNGCSTQQHALELTQAGIPAVVGTSQSINDEVAANLAIRFYKGIANGAALEKAWRDAEDYIKTQKGTANFRALYWEGKEEIEDRFPWDIFYKKGGEKVKGWNLPEAVNDPLFGMPEIPDSYGLPETPFLFLNRYERKHAKIFFGRSFYIRELYNRITDPKSPPIILLYGQSGVGKSSLLDAGLMPRIEESHTVLYVRRIQKKGLIGSLEESLQRASSNSDHLSLGEKWRQIESQTNKPLVVILDQVEEVYTHPNKDLPNEFQDFLGTLKKTFEKPTLYPVGKLILGYRKEYHPEIDKACGVYELPRAWVFVQPLDRRDIIEVVTGLTQISELRQRYNLKLDEELPVIIADDLLADKKSPVAPFIQILLTKMWYLSKKNEFSPSREFTVEQYQALQRQGIAMKDFFEQQMEKLKNWKQGVVDSGLALDILKYHTSELGTACSRGIEELRHTYGDMLDILEELIKKLKHFYLLTDVQQDKADTSLAHDTLAPVVIKEYTDSDKPGQRAARILTAKRGDFKRDEQGIWLDEADLKIVEQGRNGMRALDEIEKKLLEISQERKLQREKVKKRIRKIGIALIAFIIIVAIFAIWQWKTAVGEKRIAKANYLASQAQLKVKEDPTIALRLAEKARDLDRNKIVTAALNKIYSENSFYKIVAKLEGNVSSVAFSPDGKNLLTGSWDQIARLWDRQGNMVQEFKGHTKGVTSVAISPDGKTILTGSEDSTARLWGRQGNLEREFKGHRKGVTSVAFSPDGKTILTGSSDRTARLWNSWGGLLQEFKGHKGEVTSVAFSPDGKNILTGSIDRSARLWNWQGNLVKKFKGHTKGVMSVAFSPDGKAILTGSSDRTGRLCNLWGRLLQEFKGHKDEVTSVAFSPDGKTLLTSSNDKTTRLWEWQGKLVQRFKGHTGFVSSVSFSPDGKATRTGSNNRIARSWNRWEGLLQELKGHKDEVTSMAFSRDGINLLTFSQDGTARLWDRQGNLVQEFKGYTKRVTSVSFPPDGTNLLAGLQDAAARLWNRQRNLLQEFKGHKDEVTSMAFSPDGKNLLTGSQDGTARLWDRQRNLLQEFKGHIGEISFVAFSPDGKTILTGSMDNTARLWDMLMPLEEFLKKGLCEKLSREQKKEYGIED
jgi:WD40 repeat protein